ncbi:MAG: aminotransferase class IV [Polyangiales bacterium]
MTPVVVLNGELRLADDALVPLNGVLASFGEGALEVFRTTAHGPFLASRHLARLRRTCERLGIPAEDAEQDLIHDLNVLSGAGKGPWRVRLIRSRFDSGAMRALIAETFTPSELLSTGARLTLREGIVTPLAIKTTSYVASRVLRREALAAGFDECLLHLGGELMEGASSNIVLVIQDVLVSPTSPWILDGVTLQHVLQSAMDLGLETEHRPVALTELAGADEVFMTSAIRGPIPVREVDGQKYRIGRVFDAVRQRYEADLQSDWGELQEETVAGARDLIENRLAKMGEVKGGDLLLEGESFLLRWSGEALNIRLATPYAGGGGRLRALAKALQDAHH